MQTLRYAFYSRMLRTCYYEVFRSHFDLTSGLLLCAFDLCLCVCQMNVTTVRENLPKGDFSIMTEMLKKFLNFMNLTVSHSFNKIIPLMSPIQQ